jgi:hypothetical protein
MIAIFDLFDMLVQDPQIEANEARYLINEIVNSITKSRALEGVLVIVSLPFAGSTHHQNNKPAISYNKTILTRFDKCIEIINSMDKENKMIDIKIRSNSRNNIRSNKSSADDFYDGNCFQLIKEI